MRFNNYLMSFRKGKVYLPTMLSIVIWAEMFSVKLVCKFFLFKYCGLMTLILYKITFVLLYMEKNYSLSNSSAVLQ